jgi:anti-sigma28 factor (negative regulator of flagellin synthesis)
MKNGHPIDLATPAERLAAAEWEALLGRLRASPEVRLQRLRDAIANGDFHVDARSIAEHLIRRLLAS